MNSNSIQSALDNKSNQGVFTLTQMAAFLGKSPQTIFNWRAKGIALPAEIKCGGKPHYTIASIKKWLDDSEAQAVQS